MGTTHQSPCVRLTVSLVSDPHIDTRPDNRLTCLPAGIQYTCCAISYTYMTYGMVYVCLYARILPERLRSTPEVQRWRGPERERERGPSHRPLAYLPAGLASASLRVRQLEAARSCTAHRSKGTKGIERCRRVRESRRSVCIRTPTSSQLCR